MPRPLDLDAFLADHPVFGLALLAEARGEPERREAARNQIKKHLKTGRVKSVSRGIYAAVPPGLDPLLFQPDPFLVARAGRPDGIFAYHSALELFGHGHSMWTQLTLHCDKRRSPIRVGNTAIHFLAMPSAWKRGPSPRLGVEWILHHDQRMAVTGRARTLVESFRRPDLVGGLDELVEAARGFPSLDFEAAKAVLEVYDESLLWAAVGWLSEVLKADWGSPDSFVETCRNHRPRQNRYLARARRGGRLLPEWRLIVPDHLLAGFKSHASY